LAKTPTARASMSTVSLKCGSTVMVRMERFLSFLKIVASAR
jgi:hypothetical protein